MIDHQTEIRSALELVGVHVPNGAILHLTDGAAGPAGDLYLINYGQLEGALDEYRSVTGETLGEVDDFEAALGWH